MERFWRGSGAVLERFWRALQKIGKELDGEIWEVEVDRLRRQQRAWWGSLVLSVLQNECREASRCYRGWNPQHLLVVRVLKVVTAIDRVGLKAERAWVYGLQKQHGCGMGTTGIQRRWN